MGDFYIIVNDEKKEYFSTIDLGLGEREGLVAKILFELCFGYGRWEHNPIRYVSDVSGQNEEYFELKENYRNISKYLEKEFEGELIEYKLAKKIKNKKEQDAYMKGVQDGKEKMKQRVLDELDELVKLDKFNLAKLKLALKEKR